MPTEGDDEIEQDVEDHLRTATRTSPPDVPYARLEVRSAHLGLRHCFPLVSHARDTAETATHASVAAHANIVLIHLPHECVLNFNLRITVTISYKSKVCTRPRYRDCRQPHYMVTAT